MVLNHKNVISFKVFQGNNAILKGTTDSENTVRVSPWLKDHTNYKGNVVRYYIQADIMQAIRLDTETEILNSKISIQTSYLSTHCYKKST